MKNTSIALFAVLFAAVIALFVLQFTGNKSQDNAIVANTESSATGIAYVEIDTVIFKFNMFSDKRDELLAKQTTAENQLNAQGRQYERNAADYQDKVNKGLVTRATAAEMEQSLYQQQQDLINLSNQLQSELTEEESVMNSQIMDYLLQYLKDNKDIYNYRYIFAKSFGGVVLYADDADDITNKVVEGLNAKYSTEKSK